MTGRDGDIGGLTVGGEGHFAPPTDELQMTHLGARLYLTIWSTATQPWKIWAKTVLFALFIVFAPLLAPLMLLT